MESVTSIASSVDEESLSMISENPNLDAVKADSDEPLSVGKDGELSYSPIMMGTLNDGNESMLTLLFEDVAEANDQLYNLAFQIRSPKTRKYRTDIDLFKDVDDKIKPEYIKARKMAELQGIEQMLVQSRKSLAGSEMGDVELVLTHDDRCLVQRLQKANHARRQQFEYWRRSKTRSIRAASEAIETIPGVKHHDERLARVPKHDTPSLVQPSEFTRSLPSSVPALSKDFVLRGNKSTYSGTSRGLTVHGPSGEKVSWPKPPVADPSKEDFECPFCFYFCTSRYSRDDAWRSHLKHDLRPYICTYNECTEPIVLYESWEDWTRHEQWAHQQRIWRCSEHPHDEYVELAAYEDHVRTYHAASMDQLLSSELLKSQESVSQVCDRPCPFCQCQFERSIDMQQHTAGHLEMIAMLSLPNLDNVDNSSEAGNTNSNSANRNYAESKAGDFDQTEPLAFSENSPSGSTAIVTEIGTELFKTKLAAESISFASINESNAESRRAYSSLLVGGWMSHLQGTLDGRRPPDIQILHSGPGPYADLREGRSGNSHHSDMEDDVFYSSAVPDIPDSPSNFTSIHHNHWLPEVFKQSRPSTPLGDTDQTSKLLGPLMADFSTRLEDYGYKELLEVPFEDGSLLVRLYQRGVDWRSIFFCRLIRPDPSENNVAIPLIWLEVSRKGSILEFYDISAGQGKSKLWACLRFYDYEYMVLFFCVFLALRFEDLKSPVANIEDYDLHNESVLFAGSIVDDRYQHALRLFREKDTGVVRLQASEHSGELKRKPIWTAFITHQLHSATAISRDSSRVVSLANLHQYKFTGDYNPPRGPTGNVELEFLGISDAEMFTEAIQKLCENQKRMEAESERGTDSD